MCQKNVYEQLLEHEDHSIVVAVDNGIVLECQDCEATVAHFEPPAESGDEDRVVTEVIVCEKKRALSIPRGGRILAHEVQLSSWEVERHVARCSTCAQKITKLLKERDGLYLEYRSDKEDYFLAGSGAH